MLDAVNNSQHIESIPAQCWVVQVLCDGKILLQIQHCPLIISGSPRNITQASQGVTHNHAIVDGPSNAQTFLMISGCQFKFPALDGYIAQTCQGSANEVLILKFTGDSESIKVVLAAAVKFADPEQR